MVIGLTNIGALGRLFNPAEWQVQSPRIFRSGCFRRVRRGAGSPSAKNRSLKNICEVLCSPNSLRCLFRISELGFDAASRITG